MPLPSAVGSDPATQKEQLPISNAPAASRTQADQTSVGITMESFVRSVIRERKLFAAVVAGCVALSALAAFVWPIRYEARATISTIEDRQQTPGLGPVGGLGALSGLLLGANQSQDAVAMATLESDRVIREFVQNAGIGKDLFPSRWDAGRNAWHAGEEPNAQELVKAFRSVLAVDPRPAKGIYDVAVLWRDPAQSADWVNRFIAFADTTVRTVDRERSQKRIDELVAKLRDPANQSVAETIRNAALIEMQNLVSAEVDASYKFRVIDPATVPIELESPKRARIIALGLMLGLLVASIVVTLRDRPFRAA